MMKTRLIEVSVFQAIADLFRNPPAPTPTQPSWSRPWNLYTEVDLRAGRPATAPSLFLLGMDSRDLQLKLPALVIDIGADTHHFQTGVGETTLGKIIVVNLHVLGRDRAETKDLTSFLVESLRNVPIYDYNNPLVSATNIASVLDLRPLVGGVLPAPLFPVISTLTWQPTLRQARVEIPDKERFQGMILGSQILSFRFVTSF